MPRQTQSQTTKVIVNLHTAPKKRKRTRKSRARPAAPAPIHHQMPIRIVEYFSGNHQGFQPTPAALGVAAPLAARPPVAAGHRVAVDFGAQADEPRGLADYVAADVNEADVPVTPPRVRTPRFQALMRVAAEEEPPAPVSRVRRTLSVVKPKASARAITGFPKRTHNQLDALFAQHGQPIRRSQKLEDRLARAHEAGYI
jgi:hypothetical protein